MLSWRIPYVHFSDEYSCLSLQKVISQFRFENWNFMNIHLHRKRILGLLKHRHNKKNLVLLLLIFRQIEKNNVHKNSLHFDSVTIRNIKLYLHSEYYPYDNFNGETEILHEYYRRFQSSHYFGSNDEPMLSRADYTTQAIHRYALPIFLSKTDH